MIKLQKNQRNPNNDFPATLLIEAIESHQEDLVNQLMMADTSEGAESYRQRLKCIEEILALPDNIQHAIRKGELA